MVTARLAIGSVSTLALGALLVGVMPYWLNRTHTHAKPWGVISTLAANDPASVQVDSDRAQLLKLAALKSDAASPAPAPAVPQPVVAQPVPAPLPATVAEAAPAASPAPAETSQVQMAAAEPVARPDADDDAPAKIKLININTAPVGVLNNIPGARHIGHAIVSHRPYKSVKDLVNRRVLRTSDFSRIQARLSVD